jgi:hypothetical protein
MEVSARIAVTPSTNAVLAQRNSAVLEQEHSADEREQTKPMLEVAPVLESHARRRRVMTATMAALLFAAAVVTTALMSHSGSSSAPPSRLFGLGRMIRPSVQASPAPPSSSPAASMSASMIASSDRDATHSNDAKMAAAPFTEAVVSSVPTVAAISREETEAIAAEDAAATGFFGDISERLASVNRVQMNYGVSVTDVDGDHVFEAFVCGYGSANTLLAWRNGGVLDLAPAMGLAAPTRQAIGVASCDMDADGVEEI